MTGEVGTIRLGVLTPVVTLVAGSHAGWEADGTIADVARIATAAEALGYDHVTCSEHVAVPIDAVPVRGGRYWDPLATFGYLAACTQRLRLLTDVLVVGYHHPLEIAKRYGTLDRISGGRLVLGLGVGSLREEFELLGAPFVDRGERADDHLRALRAAMSQREPVYEGRFYRFSDMVIDPCAVQERVPFWIGGRTARSLRRAVELGDGWCPFGLTAEVAGGLIARAQETAAWAAREHPLEVVLQNLRPLDPLGAPEEAAATVASLRDAGATMLSLRLVHHSLEHYLEQLEAMVAVTARM
ncbi:MAG: LLM class F420-dependent oxidoreductase [Microthrixaceae bacterium]